MKSLLYLLLIYTLSLTQDKQSILDECPDSNEYTVNLMERVLMEEKYQGFRMETGIQQVNINEIITLADVNNSSACAAIRQQGGFDFPKPDISTTYFKSGNLYIAVEHFTDTISREEGGMIEVTTGPVGAIGVLDTNFNIIKSDFIW